MGHAFADIAFTPTVRDFQIEMGSRQGYRSLEGGVEFNHHLGPGEIDFIKQRDSFYMASRGETGWPYVQHRGGPSGFVKVLDSETIGFADYSGNRQYISVGNFSNDDRVSLILMDYPNRRRLKIFGRARVISPDDEALSALEDGHYRAQVERGIEIKVEGFDWNCPQHITPRFTELESESQFSLHKRLGNHSVNDLEHKIKQDSLAEPVVFGNGPLSLVITGIRQLTPRVRSFELRDPSGRSLPEVTPGSHLRVPFLTPSGETHNRHYSISSDPSCQNVYEIAVQKEDEGRGGSKAVHQSYQLGTELHLDYAANHFPLHADARPAVLIAGGIGITPLKSMAHDLLKRSVAFEFHYAGRSRDEMAYLDEVCGKFGHHLNVYSKADKQRLDIEQVLRDAPIDSVFYVCGPQSLIGAVQAAARKLGVTRERVVVEMFI